MPKRSRMKMERRKAQRLNLPIKVRYQLLAKRKLLEEIFSQNISGGGIGLRLAQPLTKGAKIRALIHFPTAPNPVTAISEVVWCKKRKDKGKLYYDVGIRHIRIIPQDRERFVFLFCEMMINFFVLGGVHVSARS